MAKGKAKLRKRLKKAKQTDYKGDVPLGSDPEEYQRYRQALRVTKLLSKGAKKGLVGKKRLGKAASKLEDASTYTTEGIQNAPVDPFALPEDLMALSDQQEQRDTTVGELQRQLNDMAANTAYEVGDTERQRDQASSAANYDLAARGLGMSSVRDAELFDIDATAALRKSMLESQLNTARVDIEANTAGARNAFDDYMLAFEQKKAENARAIETGYQLEPGTYGFKPPKGKPKGGDGGQGGGQGGRRGGRRNRNGGGGRGQNQLYSSGKPPSPTPGAPTVNVGLV